MLSFLLIGSFAIGSEECEALYSGEGNCDICVTHYADRKCGFCKSNNKCLSYANSSLCPEGKFYYGPDVKCASEKPEPYNPPAPPAPAPEPLPGSQCSLFTDCETCTAHLADRNCGWCKTTGKCESANTTTCNATEFYYNNNAKCGADIPPPTPTPFVRKPINTSYCRSLSGTWCEKCVENEEMKCVWDFDTKECAMGDELGFFFLPGTNFASTTNNKCKGLVSSGTRIGIQVGLGIFITAVTAAGIAVCYVFIRKGETEHDGYIAQ